MSQPPRNPSGPLPTEDGAPRLQPSGQADPAGTDAASRQGSMQGPAAAAPPSTPSSPAPPAQPAAPPVAASPSTAADRASSPAERQRSQREGQSAPSWLRDLAGAWIFYSVLPAWPGIAPRFERIARFAPWIGAVLGAVQALLWGLLEGHVPLMAQVCLVLALALVLSGGLHMDGAMDTADGLAAGERLLEAMADSRVGASGVQALVVVLLLRAGALAALGPLAPAALLWAAFWSRVAPLIAMARFPYLRERGSAAFHRRHWAGLARELRPTLLLLAVLALLSWQLRGSDLLPLPIAGLALLPALVVPQWLGRRLGGHSGDSYGACVEWSESLALLVMALALVFAGDRA